MVVVLLISGNLAFPETASGPGEFKNSLGMKFVEVDGTSVLFCIWETRRQDYREFIDETERTWKSSGISQEEDHPAVMVSWEDATQFCRWLTKREGESGKLPEGWQYRLPTSSEWSLAV